MRYNITCPPGVKRSLAIRLILDEFFALHLYKKLESRVEPQLQKILKELIVIEENHFVFWKSFFESSIYKLNPGRKIKLHFFVLLVKIFGDGVVHLILEAIEVNGIRKYLTLWEACVDTKYEGRVREIIEDELRREDAVVSKLIEKKFNPARIRNIFFGYNDGLVEIIGAISGFFAAFQDLSSVLIASLTVAVAGSISMTAGAYVAVGSENEVARTESRKAAFLNHKKPFSNFTTEGTIKTTIIVGISYFIGAIIPLIPVLFGAESIIPSLIVGIVMIILVSTVLAFLSGMRLRRRIITNLFIITSAIVITYTLGIFARNTFGVSI